MVKFVCDKCFLVESREFGMEKGKSIRVCFVFLLGFVFF